jgi:Zn-dependent protease/predicted transcriptional regulator
MTTNGVRLGKIFGIDIHVDWSWFLIFMLITWSLSATFGQIHREWTFAARWWLALLASSVFFLSVLAHELAHSLAARSRGIPVKSITLFMFGGVANIQREPSSPVEEFFITIVGPLTSLFLGAVFIVLGTNGIARHGTLSASNIFSQIQPLRTMLAWLGSVNIMVGIFNMIPAFPLDGGRVIRSVFWAITNDMRRSTRWASRLGQGIAWMMIIAGSAMLFGMNVPVLGTGLFNGLWIIFIGWFLSNAASNGYRQAMIQDILEDVPVRKVMQTQLPMISSETSVDELVNNRFAQLDGQAMLVTAGEEVVGMIAINDIQKSEKAKWESTSVGEIMTPVSALEFVTPDQDTADALDRLQNLDLRQIPVMLNNRIVGLLRKKDILRWLQFQSEIR